MTFSDKKHLYNKLFSLGNLNCTFSEKMAVISLVCHLHKELKKKNPDITYYQLVYKIGSSISLPDDVIHSIAIISEDFAYECDEFPTFELKGKEMIAKIKEILSKYLPF